MKKCQSEKGSITLETSIILPLFIFMFLFINGLFGIVSVQNQMTHVLVQSAKSLSLDAYLLENIESAYEQKTRFWGSCTDLILDFVRIDTDPYFASTLDWYNSEEGNPEVARKRFVGYLTGGDETAAHEKLENLGIVDGMDGMDFEMVVDDEVVTLTVKYEIQYWFDFWDMGRIPMEQSIKFRLWK